MNKNGKHWRCVARNILPKTCGLLFLLIVLLMPLWGDQAFSTTYDDFSSGAIQTTKWTVSDPNGFVSVVPGGPQPYVLRLSGSGSGSYPKGGVLTKKNFGGNFLAGINFFNFLSSDYPPGPDDPSNPSVFLRVVGGPSDHYYIVSRAYNSSGHGIGYREFDSSNVLVSKGGVSYASTSGALVVSYDGNELSLGYSSSINPEQWSGAFQTIATFPVTFSATPTFHIGLAAGGGGSVSGDVGGLYYQSTEATKPGTPKWIFTTKDCIWSSPAVGADGTIYVGSDDYNLYAINPDGTLKWAYPTGVQIMWSSPVIGADGTVYVGSADRILFAVNPDGTLKWQYVTGGTIYSSPAVGSDGTIYVGSDDHNLYAFNPDGTIKWIYTMEASVSAAPTLGADGTIYVGSSGNNLRAINPDGTLKWVSQLRAEFASSPAIGTDGTFYMGSGYSLLAVNPDGTLKWEYVTGERVWGSAVIGTDGTIYVGSFDHNLYAINPDGTLKWTYPTGHIIITCPAIGADGTIYVGSDDWNIYAINPDGTLKWAYHTRGDMESSPAIGPDGTIYIGSADFNLYAIYDAPSSYKSYMATSASSDTDSASSSGQSPWSMFRNNRRHTGNYSSPKVLFVAKSGKGTVISSPHGIDCGSSCSKGFTGGEQITLTAIPDSGYVFAGWTGACYGTEACTPTINDDTKVEASFCTYTASPVSKAVSYKGGTITVRLKAKGSPSCPSPQITNNTDWITYTASAFTKNKGSVKLTIPEYNYSSGREGTLTIGGKTVTITQKGEPCTVSINPSSSDLFSAAGSTGTFTVETTPTDCTWSTLVNEKYASWIHVDSGATGTGSGTLGYTVGLNNTGKTRTGKITVTVGKKNKSYKVKQGNN